MPSERMTVEIWSDVACPFCLLGKRKFGRALEQFAGRDDVEVAWKSFQLQPGLRTDPSVRLHEYLAQVKGMDPRMAKQMNEQLAAAGAQQGVAFDFDRVVVANTFRAHRFMHFARAHGRQDEATERLFRAYFSEGRNVDDPATLLELGAELGLDRDALSAALESDAYTNEVNHDIDEARQLGVRGVPFFVFDRKYAVSGAQESPLFLEVLEKAHAEWRDANPKPPFEVVGGGLHRRRRVRLTPTAR